MVQNQRFIDAPLQQVFGVLADGRLYARWVVGAKHVLEVDSSWPAPGSGFRHVVGLGPFGFRGVTNVVESTPPTQLVLQARRPPMLEIRVELHLRAGDGGTFVSLAEEVVDPAPLRWCARLLTFVLSIRNAESLRRLARVVVQQRPRAGEQ